MGRVYWNFESSNHTVWCEKPHCYNKSTPDCVHNILDNATRTKRHTFLSNTIQIIEFVQMLYSHIDNNTLCTWIYHTITTTNATIVELIPFQMRCIQKSRLSTCLSLISHHNPNEQVKTTLIFLFSSLYLRRLKSEIQWYMAICELR